MKAGWEVKPLGEICEIYQPKTISSKQMVPDGEYPVYGANGVIGRYSEYNHEESQLLVTCRGATCGSVNISAPFSWITGNAMVVRPKAEELLTSFVEYFFRGAVDLDGVITGAAQPQITRKSLAPVEMPLPPLEEQRRIVALLDEAFEGLNRARENTETNLTNARELFESWLGQAFQSFEGPIDWKLLPDLSENLDRLRVPITKSQRVAGDVPYYGASGVVDFVAEVIFNENLLLISEDGANLLARTYPIAFSIHGPAWVNNHAHVLRFRSAVDQEFARLYLNSISLDDFVTGMAQPKLNQKSLNNIPIPIPDMSERVRICEQASSLSRWLTDLEQSYSSAISDLEDLRQSLLQKAFAGELT